MKRKDLEQLRALKKEIESLECDLLKPKPTLVSIFYKDYSTGKGVPKSDVGFDEGEEEASRLLRILKRKHKELEEKAADIEDWIEHVEDSEMRTIIRYYYRDGLSQKEIAEKLGYERSTVAHKLKDFWRYG